ncbi:lysylphosphatidylglycerol synthase transmembrane domain-containing protein [Chloroflexota bacterium]
MRILGILLLIFLVFKLDYGQIYSILRDVDFSQVLAAAFLILPLIALKTLRWKVVLNAQGIHYGFVSAYLAYFASMYVGFFTPGRLGEFSKAIYVAKERQISSGRAFSGVLADRLFDLYTVFVISGIAMMNLYIKGSGWQLLFLAIMVIPVILILNDTTYSIIQSVGSLLGGFSATFFSNKGWFSDMRYGLLSLSWISLFVSLILTIVAYGLYFFQCQILAFSLGLNLSILQTAYVIALAGLVTLIPISISGLGTREAVIIFYLGNLGIQADRALSFSLLVFIVFYLGTSLIGAIAWLIKPLPLSQTVESGTEIAQPQSSHEV